MATLKEIIREKSKRLQDVPDEFLTRVERTQKKIFNEIVGSLNKLQTKNDKIIISVKNLAVVDEIIQQLSKVVYGSDYVTAVSSFAKEFDKQGKINEEYFRTAFTDFKDSTIGNAILKKIKTDTVQSLLGGSLDENFLKPAEKILTNLVTSGAGFVEAVESIQIFATGGEIADGKLLAYAKQIAHDQFAYSDRGYTNAVADELEAEWYFYVGDELPTSRCFCQERFNRHFYYKEIEAWGRGENLGDCRVSGKDYMWQGANIQTNEQTIFVYLGGYNCMHSLQPVSIFDVPKDVIQRNISNGNYEPSEFEIEEIGL